MSADNYWLVVAHPDGDGFTYCMRFASDDTPHDPSALPRNMTKYDTRADAVEAAVLDDAYTEYGPVIHVDIRPRREGWTL